MCLTLWLSNVRLGKIIDWANALAYYVKATQIRAKSCVTLTPGVCTAFRR
jgi:hypothetical protein